jgi:hypothetical protein
MIYDMRRICEISFHIYSDAIVDRFIACCDVTRDQLS